jgi:malonyl-CoA O-methyltransferase
MIKSHFDNEFSLIAPDTIDKNDSEVTKITNEIKDGDSVLEVGCGKGRILKRIQENFPNCKLYGTDISDGMLSYVSKSINTSVGDIEFLPYADNQFDVVYTVECIEHSPNLRASVRELCRVCKPKGKIIIIDKQLSGWGRLSTPPWERWPDRNVLEDLLKKYCDDVSSSELKQTGYDERDDLFIRWKGIKRDMTNSTKLFLFGAGKDGRRALYYAERSEMKIDGIIDNNHKLWGTTVDNHLIYSPKDILTPENIGKIKVIISVSFRFFSQIKEQISEYGYSYGVDFFNWRNIFLSGSDNFGNSSGVLRLPSNFKLIKTGAPNKLITDIPNQNIYRLISSEFSEDYKSIYEKCKNGDLFGKYIVNTEISDIYTSEEYPVCFKHKFLPLFTYAVEWSPKMFYDYTLFMIDLYKEIDKYGLCCLDGHAFNATFYNGKFLFFDFDAIRLGKMPFFYLQEFINYHILILLMFQQNLIEKTYLYLNNAEQRLSFKDISGYLKDNQIKEFNDMYEKCYNYISSDDVQSVFTELKKYVENININDVFQTGWNGYQNELYDENKVVKLSQKQETILEMVRSVKPKTLIDLAGNMGWYEFELKDEIDRLIVADLDYACVDFVFKKVVNDKIKNIYPVYLNIVTPTPDYYRDTAIGNTAIVPWRNGAIKRFKSEMVLALAVMHHLAFSQQLSFAEIIGQFALYSTKWLIIEWIEREDSVVEPALKNSDFEWYTKENFEEELKKQFNILSVKNSEPTRILYLCEKKD